MTILLGGLLILYAIGVVTGWELHGIRHERDVETNGDDERPVVTNG